MSKNVAVFVDVANIFYAAKAAGVDIDYVTLLKSATAGRDFIRAYAYTGLDPENENQRQFQSFLARNGYKVVSKDIRKYGDGKVKANLDIELVVDLMKTARNVDIAVVVSGDGDFAPAIRAVQEMGVRVEVISFRGNTSSDLIEVADQFTDITQLAKVERTGRSGRRVAAAAEADLSMTVVPEKETEGAPRRRSRSTRAAAAVMPAETTAEAAPAPSRGRRGGRAAATVEHPSPAGAGPRSAAEALAAAGIPALRLLPGERLSRVSPAQPDGEIGAAALSETGQPESDLAEARGEEAGTGETPATGVMPSAEEATGPAEGEGRRRRRRRGGRGRGRGRGRERELTTGGGIAAAPFEGEADAELGPEADEAVAYPSPRPPQHAFGSIWDSQLGMNAPSRPAAELPAEADEDLEEPEIPEYLLAERRRGGQDVRGRPGRGRGARGAYAAALDRERFGRAGGPSQGWPGDRGGRPGRGPRGRGAPPGHGPARQPVFERGPSAEPWSEVPPALEEQIRAQLAATASPPAGGASERTDGGPGPAAPAMPATAAVSAPPETRAAPSRGSARGRVSGPRRRTTAASAEKPPATAATPESGAGSAPGGRTRRASSGTASRTSRARRVSDPGTAAEAAGGGAPQTAEGPKRQSRPRTPKGSQDS